MSTRVAPGATGAAAEAQGQAFLERAGLRLVERNYRCRQGEIDLVMQQGDTLVFVEVRYRRRNDFGTAAESVGSAKQRRLVKAADHFLQSRWNGPAPRCRFDVLAISGKDTQNIEWIADAFQAL